MIIMAAVVEWAHKAKSRAHIMSAVSSEERLVTSQPAIRVQKLPLVGNRLALADVRHQ